MSKTKEVIPGANCSVICYATYFLKEMTLFKTSHLLIPKGFRVSGSEGGVSVSTKLGEITSQSESGSGDFAKTLVRSFEFPGNAIMFFDLLE